MPVTCMELTVSNPSSLPNKIYKPTSMHSSSNELFIHRHLFIVPILIIPITGWNHISCRNHISAWSIPWHVIYYGRPAIQLPNMAIQPAISALLILSNSRVSLSELLSCSNTHICHAVVSPTGEPQPKHWGLTYPGNCHGTHGVVYPWWEAS